MDLVIILLIFMPTPKIRATNNELVNIWNSIRYFLRPPIYAKTIIMRFTHALIWKWAKTQKLVFTKLFTISTLFDSRRNPKFCNIRTRMYSSILVGGGSTGVVPLSWYFHSNNPKLRVSWDVSRVSWQKSTIWKFLALLAFLALLGSNEFCSFTQIYLVDNGNFKN